MNCPILWTEIGLNKAQGDSLTYHSPPLRECPFLSERAGNFRPGLGALNGFISFIPWAVWHAHFPLLVRVSWALVKQCSLVANCLQYKDIQWEWLRKDTHLKLISFLFLRLFKEWLLTIKMLDLKNLSIWWSHGSDIITGLWILTWKSIYTWA